MLYFFYVFVGLLCGIGCGFTLHTLAREVRYGGSRGEQFQAADSFPQAWFCVMTFTSGKRPGNTLITSRYPSRESLPCERTLFWAAWALAVASFAYGTYVLMGVRLLPGGLICRAGSWHSASMPLVYCPYLWRFSPVRTE